MSLIVVETIAEQPLTNEILNAAHERLTPCLSARHANWRYSLLSSDRLHLVCTYDAPDAESVRDAYRRGRLGPSRVWSGNLIQPEGNSPGQMPSLRTVIEGTYPRLSEAALHEIQAQMICSCTECGGQWLHAYLSLDRTRLICEMNIHDLETMQHVQHKLQCPIARIWSAQVLSPATWLQEFV